MQRCLFLSFRKFFWALALIWISSIHDLLTFLIVHYFYSFIFFFLLNYCMCISSPIASCFLPLTHRVLFYNFVSIFIHCGFYVHYESELWEEPFIFIFCGLHYSSVLFSNVFILIFFYSIFSETERNVHQLPANVKYRMSNCTKSADQKRKTECVTWFMHVMKPNMSMVTDEKGSLLSLLDCGLSL